MSQPQEDRGRAAAYDLLPDGVVVVDGPGVVRNCNQAAARLLGVTPPEAAIGRPAGGVLRLRDEADRDWWDCTMPLRRMRAVRGVPERLLRVVDGPAVLVTASFVRRPGGEGPPEHTLICLRSAAARERAERGAAELVSTVAHELRSPLTSVKGFTATLLAKWERFTDEQKRLMLETVNADADRVTRLLTELLDVSRIDTGRLELHRQVVDLAAAARRAVAGRVAAGESAERFGVEVSGPLPDLWLDPDKIDQVVGNLLENALRHGAGRVRLAVCPRPGREEPGAVLVVTDEGEGVPEELHGRIFTKFFRGRARRGGTGLGLYIVKGLVEAHGGWVGVGTTERGGACFTVSLPAGRPSYEL